MEIKDLPQTTTEFLPKEKENDLFMSIILGRDVTEKIETSKGVFEIKFPRMKDFEEIGRRVAYKLNGISASCFDYRTYNLYQMIATLDVIVVQGPAWFESAKKKNSSFSWSFMPSESFMQEVYAKALEFRQKVQELIEQNQNNTDRKMDNVKNDNDVNDAGLFEGLQSSSRISR